ncbi:MAG: phosphatase PAP2 family protein [Spirochaetaceae bacterium]|jgi:membrane-associated phospholipid phosphatase|nr:phosphatase PAP2 family protein [Spirochaetaceae bacterium]
MMIFAVWTVWGEDLDAHDLVPAAQNEPISIFSAFHDIGWNFLHSVTYNYGANFVVAGVGTYGIIASGLDWGWYTLVYDCEPLLYVGDAAGIIGYGVPVAGPVAAYMIGRFTDNRKLQVLGAALAQSALLSTGTQIFLKVWTGRRQAGVGDRDPQTTDYSGDFAFGFLRRGVIDGWPSGHMANALSAAVVVSEIYDDNIWIKIAAYTYAAAIGIGMTFSDHWMSDIFAGALMGYAIGKTVSKSFKQLLSPKPEGESALSFYCTPNSIGVLLRI